MTMSPPDEPSLAVTHEIRDGCVCLHLQRAARAMARRFDEVFRPLGITNGQFSVLVALNRPDPPRLGEVAALLAMDRTTLTAALKPLARRDLVAVRADPGDGRSRRLHLTEPGRALLREAVPRWREEHARLAIEHPGLDLELLRGELRDLAGLESDAPPVG
jgi:DNA-binding MarR family transcriptional regulator